MKYLVIFLAHLSLCHCVFVRECESVHVFVCVRVRACVLACRFIYQGHLLGLLITSFLCSEGNLDFVCDFMY